MTAAWVKDLVGTSVRPAVFGIGGNPEMRSDLVKSDEAARWWNTDTASDPPTRSKREGAVVDSIPTPEIWKPVPGYEAYYEVSDQGRVRSFDRQSAGRSGCVRNIRGKLLSPGRRNQHGHIAVALCSDGGKTSHYVHQLVMRTFVGPCPEGMEVCHANDRPTDNRLENLRYDTSTANKLDILLNGNSRGPQRKTHCKRGHEFTEGNTTYSKHGGRRCLTCKRDRNRIWMQSYVDKRRPTRLDEGRSA